jgi:predicted TIM-barrel fold metal-dependent hydrolase
MKFDHPIIDTDGHLLEVVPHVAEYVREIGSAAVADRFVAQHSLGLTAIGGKAVAWWGTPRDALDRATSVRAQAAPRALPELGIDFAVVYPTTGLSVLREPDPEMRDVATRAFNSYYAEHMRDLSDRITIPAAIPMDTPAEALEHLDFAVGELGLQGRPHGQLRAPPTSDGVLYDVFGVDSAYDYDPVWQHCVDLGVAVTVHSGSQAIGFRSTTSYMYNHVGHFAEAGHANAKAMLMGGVTRRFPKLNFAFLEGGAAWAVIMLADVIARFEKRSGGLHPQPRPRPARRRDVLRTAREARRSPLRDRRGAPLDQRAQRHPSENLDEFWRMEAKSAEDIVELFVPRFYFGCEADDPTNAWAFAPSNPHGVRLRAVLGSDLGHWDVPDAREVLPEAYELVEHGLLTADDFREFTCDNAIRLHGGMNPRFFDGTAVEAYARDLSALTETRTPRE